MLEVVTLIIIVIITEIVCVNFLSNISVRFVGVFNYMTWAKRGEKKVEKKTGATSTRTEIRL